MAKVEYTVSLARSWSPDSPVVTETVLALNAYDAVDHALFNRYWDGEDYCVESFDDDGANVSVMVGVE